MAHIEDKWKANADKVAFAKSFPGLLWDWEMAIGKRVERINKEDERGANIVIFEDGTFILVPLSELRPVDIIKALIAGRPFLEPYHPDAFQQLDRHIANDKEMQRKARLENIIGAVRNNLSQIPELKEALRSLLEEG
ncbi:MAG: hypothetical protein ACE5HN_01535 [Nitrospiria bacterium]